MTVREKFEERYFLENKCFVKNVDSIFALLMFETVCMLGGIEHCFVSVCMSGDIEGLHLDMTRNMLRKQSYRLELNAGMTQMFHITRHTAEGLFEQG